MAKRKKKSNQYYKQRKREQTHTSAKQQSVLKNEDFETESMIFYNMFSVQKNNFMKSSVVWYITKDLSIKYSVKASKDGEHFSITPYFTEKHPYYGILSPCFITFQQHNDFQAPNLQYPIPRLTELGVDHFASSEEYVAVSSGIAQRLIDDICFLNTRWSAICTLLYALQPQNLHKITNRLGMDEDEKSGTMFCTTKKILASLSLFDELDEFTKLYKKSLSIK